MLEDFIMFSLYLFSYIRKQQTILKNSFHSWLVLIPWYELCVHCLVYNITVLLQISPTSNPTPYAMQDTQKADEELDSWIGSVVSLMAK